MLINAVNVTSDYWVFIIPLTYLRVLKWVKFLQVFSIRAYLSTFLYALTPHSKNCEDMISIKLFTMSFNEVRQNYATRAESS